MDDNTATMSSKGAQSNKAEKLPMPEDASSDAPKRAHSADAKEGSKSGSKSGTSLDTIIGRVVVEQGLATENEVREAADRHRNRTTDDPNQGSLAERLVHDSVITKKQLDRLRGMVEAERSGQQIPGYRILGKLGAGAMATVFKGKQLSLDRTVAIKVLPRRYSSNEDFIRRFYAEGRAAAQLNHPNIVQAYDVGRAGEFHYFVMEYVEGSTVYDRIVAHKRFSEADAIDIAIQTAEALEHAHERDLIHRDVKPKNIMLARDGVVKLADMGLARALSDKEAAEAEAGKAFGTPYYISPEQIRGAVELTPAADIYSLGATLYHMVTGAVPYDGKSPSDVMRKHLKAELIPPDHVNPKLSAAFAQIIEMMMAKTVHTRYRCVKNVLTDLRALRAGEPLVFAKAASFTGANLSEIAQAEQTAVGEIPVDSTRAPSPLRSPIVQIMLTLLIVSVVANLALIALMAAG